MGFGSCWYSLGLVYEAVGQKLKAALFLLRKHRADWVSGYEASLIVVCLRIFKELRHYEEVTL